MEMMQAALGLGAPQPLVRDFNLAKGIAFGSAGSHFISIKVTTPGRSAAKGANKVLW
jgi:hypothetical protein